MNVAALVVPRDDDDALHYRLPYDPGFHLLPGGSRRDPWHEVSYPELLWGDSAAAAPAFERLRAAAANVARGFPPAYRAAAAPGTQGTASTAPKAGFGVFSLRRQRPAVRLYRVFATAAGRHRQQRAAVISPLRVTAVAVFLAGRKRGAVRQEWRNHLSELTRQGLSSRDQTPAACGFLWAALRYRLRDAVNLACGPVDALLRSRTLSNLLVLIPTLTAALYILRHLGTLGVLTSAEGISAIGGALYGLVRAGRWWRDVKPPEPKARRIKEQ